MSTIDFDIDWSRTLWIGFGLLLAVAILFVLHSFVGTFVMGIFLYYATRPLYGRVRRRVRQRTLSALISLLLLALPIIILLYYTIAIALQELARFVDRTDLGPFETYLEPYIDLSAVVQNPQALYADAGGSGFVFDTASQVLSYVGLIGTGLIHGFVMLAIAFYLLRDGPRLAEWSKTYLDRRGTLDQYFTEVDRSFDRVFYGNILNAIVTAAIGAIAFSVLDIFAPAGLAIPYPALMGLLAGAASLIPIIGMKIVYVPLAAYLAIEAVFAGDGWWFVGVFVAVALIIVDTIPDLVIRPYVSGGGSIPINPFGSKPDQFEDQPGLHTGTLMFAYILGPFLFGWYGIFLAPMILVLIVHFARFVLPELLMGTEIQPHAVDPSNVLGEEPVVDSAAGQGAGASGGEGQSGPASGSDAAGE